MPTRRLPSCKSRPGPRGARTPASACAAPYRPSCTPPPRRSSAAAKKLLAERGYQGMTLQAISAEAKVNKAGVWYYFGGKQQLVLALLEDVTVGESLHFGTMPPESATLAERVDLHHRDPRPDQGESRALQRPSTSCCPRPRATPSCAPPPQRATTRSGTTGRRRCLRRRSTPRRPASGGPPALGQLASILLDGIILEVVIAAPEFDLEAALDNARRALLRAARDAAGARESRHPAPEPACSRSIR